MDDPFPVRRVECLGDLTRDRERLGDGQRPAGQTIGERRPFDELEDQRGHAVRFFEPVDRADVRMVERREQARFAREAGAALGIGREVRRQDLDRDVTTELAVARAIDLAHATGAERRHDRVRAEVPADHLASVWSSPEVARGDRRRSLEEPR